ncbi:methenyltetrahydromethanopterin cyclohydrolase, partial [Mesorhizobium sp. M7A.F.Ca.US.006.01.1.1]
MKDGSAFLNDNAQRIVDGMISDAERLRIVVSTGPLGERL